MEVDVLEAVDWVGGMIGADTIFISSLVIMGM